MRVLSVPQQPGAAPQFISCFQSKWADPDSMMVYEDCVKSCLDTDSPLPRWYLLMDGEKIAGCAGLITNALSAGWTFIPGCAPCMCSRSTGERETWGF